MSRSDNHAQLFDEICGKLAELSHTSDSGLVGPVVHRQTEPLSSLAERCRTLELEMQQLEAYSQQQNEILKSLKMAAEKKMIELKMALDKKSLEAEDYHQHLQLALEQISLLRQENLALREHLQGSIRQTTATGAVRHPTQT